MAPGGVSVCNLSPPPKSVAVDSAAVTHVLTCIASKNQILGLLRGVHKAPCSPSEKGLVGDVWGPSGRPELGEHTSRCCCYLLFLKRMSFFLPVSGQRPSETV